MNTVVFAAARRAGLTHAQAAVLACYVESEKAGDTAQKLGLSEQTVKNHLYAIRRKLGTANTTGAVTKLLTS